MNIFKRHILNNTAYDSMITLNFTINFITCVNCMRRDLFLCVNLTLYYLENYNIK